MVHLNKILKISIQKRIGIKQIARDMNLNASTIYRMINTNNGTIQTLQSIADALEVPIETFFRVEDEEGNGYSNETLLQIHAAEIKERIEYTQRLEEIISLQRDLITFLKNNQKP